MTKKILVKACQSCRSKKVKCDGKFPICGNCTSAHLSECSYGPSQRGKVIKLWKKEACFPCRRKKKRCDAVRPLCGKCRVSRTKTDPCVYEFSPKEYSKSRDPALHDLSLTIASSPESEEFAKSLTCFSSIVSPSKPNIYQVNPSLSFSHTSPEPMKPSIVRNPPLSLQDVDDPFAFALSGVSLDDLNLRFRITFYSKRFIYGVFFPPAKLEVFLRGDTSSPLLHPFFIHFGHLCGSQFYQEEHGQYFLLHVQAGHLLLSREALKTIQEKDDPFTYAQAHFYLGFAYTYARSILPGKRHLKRAVEALRRNNIRFVPMSTGDMEEYNPISTVVEPLDLVRERITLLSGVVFVEIMFYLVGQPSLVLGFKVGDDYKSEMPMFYSDVFIEENIKPVVHVELEQQFRYELPGTYPFLATAVLARVQSAVFAKDASNLISWFKEQATPSESWLSTCQIFLTHLASHITDLNEKLIRTQDAEVHMTLRVSCILSLTTYAQIIFVLSVSPTSSASSAAGLRQECNNALKRVISLVEEIEETEFLTLNALLGIVWSRALQLFNTQWASSPLSPATSQSLSPMSSKTLSSTTSSSPSPATSFSSPVTTVSSTLYPSDGSQDHASNSSSDLTSSIARLAQLNNQFIQYRYIPGTATLCTSLAEHIVTVNRDSKGTPR